MRTLHFLLPLALASCLASAATVTDYEPTRDTFMRGGPTDLHGTSTNGRASKAYLDFYLADFDREEIRSSIEGVTGRPLAFEDMSLVELAWNLFSNDFQGYQPRSLSRPAVFKGAQEWVEGTNSTFGATKAFAFYDPLDETMNLRWMNSAGAEVGTFLEMDRVENAVFEEWGGEPYTYRRWVLDDAVAFAYLTDPFALGLFLNASDVGDFTSDLERYNNTEVYSRETTSLDRRPFLQVTVIPEPGTGVLAALAGLLLWGRRLGRQRAGQA